MAERREQVVPIDMGVPSPVDGAVPILLTSEFHAIVLVDSGLANCAGRELVIVRWSGVRSIRFDVLGELHEPGHYLYEAGYHDVRLAGEVVDSEWAEEERRHDTGDQRHWHPEARGELRHFVMRFNDSAFECLARGWSVELTTETPEQVVPRLWPRLFPSKE